MTSIINKYQKKYIKYKNKYLQTKKLYGGNSNKKILLMFLGGATSSINLINHLKIMNDIFINKNNYYVVIHPISLPYVINEEFQKIFNPNNIFVVDENHHLLTGWYTKSLSDATLMMMQYAHNKNCKSLFDKYILLSPNCCPIYTFDKIYDYLMQNDKSYLDFNNSDPVQVNISNTRNNKILTGSQWMILDKQHVKIFFPVDITNTYKKRSEIINCSYFNQKIQIIEIIDNLNIEHSYINIIFNLFSAACNNTDERFFITSILYYIIHEKKNKNWREELDLFNLYNTKYKIYNFPPEIYDKLKNIYDNLNKKVKYIYPIYVPRNLKWHTNYLFDTYSNPLNNMPGIPNNDKYLKITNNTTYCDWLFVSIDPLNFLRNFEYTSDSPNIDLYLKNDPINNFCILKNLVTDCKEFTNKLKCIKKVNDYIKTCNAKYGVGNDQCQNKPNFGNCVIFPYSHPLEYYYWNIKSILNAFILINKLKCIIPEFNEKNDIYYNTFNCIYHLYKKILILEFNIIDENINKTLSLNWSNLDNREQIRIENKIDNEILINIFLQNPKLEEILQINIGTYITHNTIVSAINSNSLFIRKCYDTSFIQEYSNVLKDCNIMNIMNVPIDEVKSLVIEKLQPTNPIYSFDEELVLKNYTFPEIISLERY